MEEQEAVRTGRKDRKNKTPGVGHKKPPVETQFKEGVSGNPKGRPVSKNDRRAIVTRVAKETLDITENGVIRKLQTREALLVVLRSLALQGKGAKYHASTVKKLLPEDPKRVPTIFMMPDGGPPEECFARVEKYQQELAARSEIEMEQLEEELERKHREKYGSS